MHSIFNAYRQMWLYAKIYLHSIQNADDEEDRLSSEEEKQQIVEKKLLSREKRTAYMRD